MYDAAVVSRVSLLLFAFGLAAFLFGSIMFTPEKVRNGLCRGAAILLVVLLFSFTLFGCGKPSVPVTNAPDAPQWDYLGDDFYRIWDPSTRVACYRYQFSGSLSCVRL